MECFITDTSIKYTTNNLVEFESVIDVDLSTIMVVLNKIRNIKLYKPTITTSISENKLKNLLLFRTNKNPLSAIFDDKYSDSFDTLLAEIKDAYGDEILDISMPTDILKLIVNLSIAKNIIFSTIYCHSEKEKNVIERFTKDLKFIVSDHITKDIINSTNCFFIKYIDTITQYIELSKLDQFPLTGKYIYIINASYNLGPKFVPKPIVALLGETNVIRMVDMYKDLTVPNANLEGLLNERIKNNTKQSIIKHHSEGNPS